MARRQRAICLVAACLMTCWATSANANCRPLPPAAQAYLKSHPDWSPVAENDLVSDDVLLWQRYHANQCPGMAVVKLSSGGNVSYALALLHREGDRTTEKLVVIERNSSRTTDLVSAAIVVSPFVAWRAAPGIFHDQISNKDIHVRHDAIIYEKMEASATAYYLVNGKFRPVVTSN